MVPTEMLTSLAEQVRALARSETVVGDPVTIGDATIVPITRVTVGFGGGAGSGDAGETAKASRATGTGGGGGGAVRMEPAAFIVMQHGELSILAAPGKRGALAGLFEQVPELIDKLSAMQAKKAEEGNTSS